MWTTFFEAKATVVPVSRDAVRTVVRGDGGAAVVDGANLVEGVEGEVRALGRFLAELEAGVSAYKSRYYSISITSLVRGSVIPTH